MKARTSTQNRTLAAVLCGAFLTASSFGVAAQDNATLADSRPFQATLMPTLSVTASASDPSAAQSWRLSSAKPVSVTLMPVLTVGIGADSLAVTTLPTIVVLADIKQAQPNGFMFASVAALPGNRSFVLAD